MTKTLLIQKLDRVFSSYIRIKHSKDGYCTCYTCGKSVSLLLIDCGHFISRSHMATRWDQNNTRPQCTDCNRFRSGNLKKFEENLIKQLGLFHVELLKEKSKQITKFTRNELVDLYQEYTEKLKEAKKLQLQ